MLVGFATIVTLLAHPGAGIVVDDSGVIYFAQGPGYRIWQLAPDADAPTVLVQGVDGGDLSVPHHLVLTKNGSLYTASDRNGAVVRIEPDGDTERVFPPADFTLSFNVGAGGDPFTIDSDGNVYCFDGSRRRTHSVLLRISAQGEVTELAGGEIGFRDGQGGDARFGRYHGSAFAWGPNGDLFMTDAGTRVRRVTPDGRVTTIAGGEQPGFADGPGNEARFNGAMGLAVAESGAVYVADSGNHRIRVISPKGIVSTLAGVGERAIRDGAVDRAAFSEPVGVAVAPDGSVCVIDVSARLRLLLVRRISPDGRVSTLTRMPEMGIPDDLPPDPE